MWINVPTIQGLAVRSDVEMKNRKRKGDGDPVFNPKRRLRDWNAHPQEVSDAEALAGRLKYTGNPAQAQSGRFQSYAPFSAPTGRHFM